ncbi:killer toxin subunits alpha/beta [Phialemonium atrogriseum]|uniref:chitinase n=1 Tax=Phialemonium atrogriseum TaxID=1093897 RepID=A0AAJ0FHN3_9PEZI|nr:killer toxin subunits alpha/beta [Phialemonium atrogriseum]KAK1767907.1 killer toxin subunits alpha/beta [Phialemonium atrogriseum]
MRSTTLLFSLLSFLLAVLPVEAQECSATKKCATGCCSEFGFCGTSEEHCGAGCLSTCEFKLGCDVNNPCPDGTCCSKFGFCGFGKDFCSRENCATGCDAKSQCDPGTFGSDFVELKKCPLNVCCSKWGCQAFMPEDVPLGVYTHLNFAFASIDPKSYKIVPAQAEDIALYSRLTALKKSDSALKVFIAIGGWTFNDDGPTFHTFSELAADESKQKVFFASLISFMSTYNFDGVDIDWEYPVDKDRGGNAADYDNFPKFMKNLKAALDAGSGGRNGISITLPVSFWYLQNFDIVELEKWVDFFNIMSYDLHGLWDKGNKWLGAFLNSHSNMTEITEYLDLFWRNDIKPEKVTLGLAFYSRTFLAADKGCTKAKCMFDAVGEAGPCSKDDIGGTLTNAELTDQIRAAGVTPTLDKDAMVKVAVIGRKWISYDDEDTFKLKVDAARKMCLGGVMVWAVSQDYTDKTAKVAAAVGKKRAASGLFDTRYSAQLQSATRIVRNQCYWSNCGAGCGKGYKAVPRLDNDGRDDEVMQDSRYCQGGTLRHFCCPNSKTIPKCGWFDFFNGKCGKRGGCPAGSEEIVAPADQQREVGSTQVACNNGKAQVACCQTETESGKALDSLIGYDICKWYGTTTDKCDAIGAIDNDPDIARSEACSLKDSDRPNYMIESLWGSGATYCRNPNFYKDNDQFRPLCCKRPEVDVQWNSCTMVFAERKDGNFCQAHCPAGTIRMAMEQPAVYESCKGGANAICCEPRFLTEANNADEVHHGYVLALENVLQNPDMCEWGDIDKDTLQKRGFIDYAADCRIALQGTMNMLGSPDIGVQQRYVNDWNLAVNQAGMYGIPASAIQSQPEGYAFSTAPSAPIQTDVAEGILNSAKDLNEQKQKPAKHKWTCPVEWIWDASLDIRVDPDDGGWEVIEPDLQGVHTQLRRRDDLGPEVPISAVQEEEDGDYEAPYPRRVNWLEGIANLRRFHLKNKDKDNTADTPNKPKLRRRDADSCEQSFRCRAGMLGFDLSKREDRLAYFNVTLAEAQGRPKRYAEALERRNRSKNRTLEERDSYQMGQPRSYTVKSWRYSASQWPGDIIESSQYPNGNQGDDLIYLNNDPSRYVVKSTGCGPQDYTLKTRAAKNEVNGIWVTEHILELNTVGRFMTASLDGGLGGLGAPSHLPGFYFGEAATLHQVQMFAYNFVEWNKHTALTPADTCLLKLGSMEDRSGLVVCDSSLNLMKTKIYKLQNPVGDTTWHAWCISPLPASLERGLAYIQTIMAVFDYYDDRNVKNRHATAYQSVMEEMAYFEIAYEHQFGLDIYGEWQQRWKEFMEAHFLRVVTHTRVWLLGQLNDLYTIWHTLLQGCAAGGWEMCAYCMAAVWLINDHFQAVSQGQKIAFDSSIFDDLYL